MVKEQQDLIREVGSCERIERCFAIYETVVISLACGKSIHCTYLANACA